ncbi:alpha/beta hydrolase [Paraflavitalea soli]|uniref:Alpha/beta hydrolase n=1 Tax=Paraflavitalea soli TaxID=2315862 RepID=A0A3B7MYV0_9BACT|nr:alpha/beta hydrolase [Paraflavitalea soli]AXY75471.1 alpha/beta hydrolase [Paraflavitalea soli]
MKTYLFLLVSLCTLQAIGQQKTAADYGFRHLQFLYQGDTVHLLIKSKKGEELKPKPLFFFCQGSQPVPLIIDSKEGVYGTFPFKPDSLAAYFHLVIISKPAVPLIKDVTELSPDFTYKDSTGSYPKAYSDRNYLDYYVNRNIEVIKYLHRQPWVLRSPLVAAGHSEGATIVAKLASTFSRITHLIYSGGNPMGRIVSIVANSRRYENDSTRMAEQDIENWKAVVNNPSASDATKGDPYKTTYGFSFPPINYLQKLTIPVFVSFGTKDVGAPFNDYLQLDMIRQHKNNFTFKGYIGTEHNFFGLNADGTTNYNAFNWDKVAMDWLHWLLRTNGAR